MDILASSWLIAAVLFSGAIAARQLIHINLWVYKKLGLHRLVMFWQRRLGWWVPTVRAVCAFGAAVFILRGLGLA